MAGKIAAVTSSAHFATLLSSSTYTVVDFYADWCGPCKTIAPVFAQLAEKESRPGKLQFVKVDVDSQQDVARKYGVSAMPTFLIIKGSSVVDTIKGANPPALTAAVRKAAADATNGPASSAAAFQSKGYTLGSAAQPSRPATQGAFGALQGLLGNGGMTNGIVRFLALYVISLFAFDAYKAAESSPFNVKARR